MPPGLPTESVSGKEGWEWSRRQADRQHRNASPTTTKRQFEPYSQPTEREINLERPSNPSPDTSTRRTESEQQNRRLQRVIDHYERLLREKNRKLANQESRERVKDRRTTIATTIKECLTG